MLSKEAEKKLQQLEELLSQREEINRQIENLLIPVTVPVQQPESLPEQPTSQRKRRNRVTPNFTDAEIEKMVRESDEGKSAREIMREYGFKSTSDWYMLKSNYKKKHKQSTDPDDIPDRDDADDEEEPEDEPVLVDNPLHISNTTPGAPKRYRYECQCGYNFKSTVPPKLIKCPDCMGKPKLVEDLKEGE
jgi:hypothetical protein